MVASRGEPSAWMKQRKAGLTLSLAGLVAAAVLATAGPAHAVVAAAAPGSFNAGYATPVVVTQVGGPVTFVNADAATHTLTAARGYLPKKVARRTKRCSPYPATRCPLFTTGSVQSGASAPVDGLKYVKAGRQYEFYCQIHANMKGTLVVAR